MRYNKSISSKKTKSLLKTQLKIEEVDKCWYIRWGIEGKKLFNLIEPMMFIFAHEAQKLLKLFLLAFKFLFNFFYIFQGFQFCHIIPTATHLILKNCLSITTKNKSIQIIMKNLYIIIDHYFHQQVLELTGWDWRCNMRFAMHWEK